ncbi:MAG: cold-shock protein [Rickettsiales bacterium]
MATGVVKWFNPAKRFGFIKPDEGEQDVFVHISALEAAGLSMLDENQKIEYELADSNGKTSAVNLKLIQ